LPYPVLAWAEPLVGPSLGHGHWSRQILRCHFNMEEIRQPSAQRKFVPDEERGPDVLWQSEHGVLKTRPWNGPVGMDPVDTRIHEVVSVDHRPVTNCLVKVKFQDGIGVMSRVKDDGRKGCKNHGKPECNFATKKPCKCRQNRLVGYLTKCHDECCLRLYASKKAQEKRRG